MKETEWNNTKTTIDRQENWNPSGAELWLSEELGPNDVAIRRQTDNQPEPVVLHGHSFYELVFCKSSGGAKYLVGDTVYSLRDKDVILIPPGIGHSAVLSSSMHGVFERDVIWFNQHFINTHLGRPSGEQMSAIGRPWLIHIPPEEQMRVEEVFGACVRESRDRLKNWDRIIQVVTVYILCVLNRVLESQGFPLQREEPVPLILQIIDYVEKNLGERITLEETAERFHVSRSTLSESFRKKTGVGFYAYVIQRRLLEAKNLINAGFPMEQVAKRVGFGEYSAFYRAFKQKYGISPREYRDQSAMRR